MRIHALTTGTVQPDEWADPMPIHVWAAYEAGFVRPGDVAQ